MTTYTIKRATSQNGALTVLARGLTDRKFVDRTAFNNRMYYYVITAVNENGESLNSVQVKAMPKFGLK